ncbi:MAG: hypothetical protein L3K09_07210 [Thermoplasmata archaeon]|nr:hypothetical protein [Thermoplasmata archaeon]
MSGAASALYFMGAPAASTDSPVASEPTPTLRKSVVDLFRGRAAHGLAPRASGRYLLVMLLLLGIVVTLVEVAYHQNPIPPGPDTGKWIATSFAYVGHSYPAASGAFSNPYSYSPLTFPILGIVFLIFHNPLTAGFAYGGLMLVVYGLSLIHLSRRYLLTGPFQVALVGLALFNATTVSILFWGGYPNFLAFALFNEAIVFLLAFVRSRELWDGLAFYGALSLLYLTHDLSFAIAIAACGLTAFVLLLHRRIDWRFLAGKANLIAASLLVATVGGYSIGTRLLQIPHPGYLYANPAAYYIDNIGQVFNPVTVGCTCPGDFLPIWVAITILVLVGGTLLVVPYLARRRPLLAPVYLEVPAGGAVETRPFRPKFVDSRLLIATSWLAAACLAPVAGWFAHIDTDYTRFGYFFPLPAYLVMILALEQLVAPWFLGVGRPEAAAAPDTTSPAPANASAAAAVVAALPRRGRAQRTVTIVALFFVVIVVIIMMINTSVVIFRSEGFYTGANGSTQFLSALTWLAGQNDPGAVLTYEGHSAHWIEAMTSRSAFFPGPTWIHFYPYQIFRDEDSYWAFNSRDAITNNNVVFSFSGLNETSLYEMPMYSAYVQGVIFPILRLDPTSPVVTDLHNNTGGKVVNQVHKIGTWGNATYSVSGVPAQGSMSWHTANFSALETASIGNGGNAWLNWTVTPGPRDQVESLAFNISEPLVSVQMIKFGALRAITPANGTFYWNVTNKLGQLPGARALNTTGTMSPIPSIEARSPTRHATSLVLKFATNNSTGNAPFNVSIELSTPGTSNPAIALPPLLDTPQFFAQAQIRYIVVPNFPGAGFQTTVNYLEQEFGATVVYNNPQWTILTV